MTQSHLCAGLHRWITTGDLLGTPGWRLCLFVCLSFLVRTWWLLRFPRDKPTDLISLQQLWLPYSGCHIIIAPFSTTHEAFVAAVCCPAYVLLRMAVKLLEKSWLNIARCVTWWVFHNSLHRPANQHFGHYMHTYMHEDTTTSITEDPWLKWPSVCHYSWPLCHLLCPDEGMECMFAVHFDCIILLLVWPCGCGF